MAEVSFILRFTLRYGSLMIGCIFAIMAVFRALVGVVKKGPQTIFFSKRRPRPPECMQDPALGVNGYAYLENARLHYVSNGSEDKPLMLLVHGFPEFWYSWRYQLKEFSSNYRVVAVDQRGYGDSDKPSSVYDYRLPILVNDLKELIIALGYKKCVLVGHDWGGIVAWAFAQSVPDMVEQFIVMNAPSPHAFLKHASNSLSQLKKSWYFSFFQVPYIPELIISLLDFDFFSNAFTGKTMGARSGIVTEDDIEAYKFTFQRNGLTAPINFYRALMRYPDFAFSQLQSLQFKVMCPTLIIWGCKDGALDKELAALSTEMVAGEVTVKYIEDCSHWTQMDRPEQVNTFVYEFLKQN